MAESDALSYWPVTFVPESKLSHMATTHYGFVPKLSHHGGKTEKTGFYCFSSGDVVFQVLVNMRCLNFN